MNPFVVSKSNSFYREDTSVFRPERWLASQDDTAAVDRVKDMERLDFSFLWGPRTCLGIGIAGMEIRKDVVEVNSSIEPNKRPSVLNQIKQLVRNFDFELVNPH